MSSKVRTEGGAAARGTSLAFRLTAWYSTASFLLVSTAVGLLYYGLSGNLKRLSEQLLADELDVCRALVRERGGDMHALREEAEIDSAIRKYEKFYVRVIGENGQVLATTPGMDQELSSAHIAQEEARSRGGIFWLQSPDGTPYRAIVATLGADGGGVAKWTVQVAVDLTQEQQVLARHRVWVYTVLAAAVLLCPWAGYAIARRGTRPLRDSGGHGAPRQFEHAQRADPGARAIRARWRRWRKHSTGCWSGWRNRSRASRASRRTLRTSCARR